MFSGGGGRGGGGRGGRGGGGDRSFNFGPPDRVVPFGYFDYACQDDLVLKAEIEDVPYFNAPIFLENKSQIGKIDEIFGTLRDYYVSVKLSDNMNTSGFQPKQKVIGNISFYFKILLEYICFLYSYSLILENYYL